MEYNIDKIKTANLKGFAILSVIIGHISMGYNNILLSNLGAIGVAIFCLCLVMD